MGSEEGWVSEDSWQVFQDEPGEDALYDVFPPGADEALITTSDKKLANYVVQACNAFQD